VRLDPSLQLIVELAPIGAEELDAVVLPGVVRSRDDGADVQPEPPYEHRSRGRRQDAGKQRLPSPLGHTGGQRRLEHRSGLASVADNQHLRPIRRRVHRGRPPERQSELGGQLRPGDPADAVGAEELGRWCHSIETETSKTKQIKDAGWPAKRA
jgi:hypothetical protein